MTGMLRTNYLLTKYFFMLLVSSVDFFLKKVVEIQFFKKFFQEHYHGVKQFGSMGPSPSFL